MSLVSGKEKGWSYYIVNPLWGWPGSGGLSCWHRRHCIARFLPSGWHTEHHD